MSDGSQDPFARHPAQTRERIRLEHALTEIAATRLTGRFHSLEEVVGELGYSSVGDFWDAALAKRMPAADFAHLLKSFCLTPALNSPAEQSFDLSIEHALSLGFQANEPWASHHLDRTLVKPRETALWLLSMPSERGLVPDELREFLETAKSRSDPPRQKARIPLADRARSRGPRPRQLPRVVNEMRASDQLSRLDAMTEEEMAASFKASRDTCRRARREVLSVPNRGKLDN
jgi:hypothetical protein